MKFGLRTPSLKKRISARTSWKRYVRHSVGLKAPRGYGWVTNPKKAMYNKVYNKTSFSVDKLARKAVSSSGKNRSSNHNVATSTIHQPVSYSDPFTIAPRSFIQLINGKDKLEKDGWASLILIGGIIGFFINPLIGIVMIGGGGYWLYKMMKEPWYKVKQRFKKAKKLLKNEKFDLAIKPLQEALEFDENNPEINYMAGVTAHVLGSYEDSVQRLQKYLETHPDDLDASLVLAYSLYKVEKYKEAIPFLQKLPPDYPNTNLAIVLLGECFAGIKEYDMAIDTFKRGPLLKRNLDPFLMQLHYSLGIAYNLKGDKKNALKHLKKVYGYDMEYKDVSQAIAELE